MKNILALAILLFSIVAHSNAASLSETDKLLILQSINNACGDSWCEGPFMYDFKSFYCMEAQDLCIINFTATEDGRIFKSGSCNLHPAYEKYEDYVDPNVRGVWPTLNFYEFMSDCLSEWESGQFIIN